LLPNVCKSQNSRGDNICLSRPGPVPLLSDRLVGPPRWMFATKRPFVTCKFVFPGGFVPNENNVVRKCVPRCSGEPKEGPLGFPIKPVKASGVLQTLVWSPGANCPRNCFKPLNHKGQPPKFHV